MSGPDRELAHQRSGRARAAFSGVLWSGVNTILPVLSGMLVFLMVSRVVVPAEFGMVAFAVVIIGLLGAVAPAGFGDALVQREDISPAHLDTTFWLCLLWGGALYALVFAIAGPLSDWLGDPMLATLLPVIGLRLVFDLAGVVPMALLSRRMQFREITLRTFAASLLSLVVCLGVLWAGYGFWALVLSQLVVPVVGCLVSWIVVGWLPGRQASRAALRDLLGFGGYATGSRLVTTVNVDQLMVGAMMGNSALGLFSFARRLFAMLNDVLTGALTAVSFPLLSSMQNEPEKLRETYLATTFLSSMLAFPCFAGLALIAPTVIPLLFGEQWLGAVPALQVYCTIGLLSCIGVLQASLIRARGRADWWMWYGLVRQILTGLAIFLLAEQGVTVVAIGIAVLTWVTWPVSLVKVSQLIGLPMAAYLRPFAVPLVGISVMTSLVLALQYSAVSLGAWGDLMLQITLGTTGYVLTILALARHKLAAILRVIRK